MSLRMVTMADMMIMTTLFVSCPLIFVIVRVLNKRSCSKDLPLPPGPNPWPIVGNMFELNSNLLHVCLADMAKVYGPLMSLQIGQRTLIIGSSPTVASEILKTHDRVLSGRDVSRFLHGKEPNAHNKNLSFTSECDDGWRLLRNIYKSEVFSSKAVANIREGKIMEMMEYLGAKKLGEDIVIKDFAFATTINILGKASLSIDLVDFEGNGIGSGIRDSLRRFALLAAKPLLADMFPILRQWDLPGWYKQVMHIIERELGDIWEDSLQRKRNGSNIFSDQKDFTDILIEKGFTNQQINPLMEELFAAGTETTSLTIEWFIAELLKNQEAMQKAKDEVTKHTDGNNVVKESDLFKFPFLEACFKETLRLHPPGPLLLPHKALERCEVMGYTIPKDSQIFVNVWAINRDPNIWDDPLSFKPERFMGSNLSYNGKDFEFLPFGSGRRMCPGQVMASKMVLLTIASLILNFDVFLPNNMNVDDINMDEEYDIAMHKKEPLLITLKTREYLKN